MKKISLFFIVLFISIITFSFGYDELLNDAQQLAFSGDYDKAENLYSKLIEDFQTEELYISYANTLAWQGKYDEAITLLENSGIESNQILETKAKFLIWAKEYERGIRLLEELKSQGYSLSSETKTLMDEYYNFKFNNVFVEYKTEIADDLLSSELSGGYTYNNRNKYKIGFSANLVLLNYLYNNYSVQTNFSKDFYNIYLGLSDKQYYFIGAELYIKNFIITYKNSLYKGNEDILLKYSLLNEGSLGYAHSYENGYLNIFGILINTTDFFESKNENVFSYYFRTNFNYLNLYTNYYFNFDDVNNINASYKFSFDEWYLKILGEYDFISNEFYIGGGVELTY